MWSTGGGTRGFSSRPQTPTPFAVVAFARPSKDCPNLLDRVVRALPPDEPNFLSDNWLGGGQGGAKIADGNHESHETHETGPFTWPLLVVRNPGSGARRGCGPVG